MEQKDFIKFLGTAGARFVMALQLRSSAGIYGVLNGKRFILDPGPGTLVRCAKARPRIDLLKLDYIFLTHVHIDHSNDINVIIDAMTEGGLTPKGTLFAPAEAVEGENKVIFNYVKNFLNKIEILKPFGEYSLDNNIKLISYPHRHTAETYGLKFITEKKVVSFIVDTEFFPELIDYYQGSNIIIINTVMIKFPEKHRVPVIKHLSVGDTKKIITAIKPEKVVLTHFGMQMVKAKPWEVAEKLAKETGLNVIAANDGSTIEL